MEQNGTGEHEIIETYWNVNESEYAKKLISLGNNRNILECKLFGFEFRFRNCLRNNRNILECK